MTVSITAVRHRPAAGKRLQDLRRLAAPLILALAAIALASQAQPLDGPLHIVVGYAPGGATHRVARIVSDTTRERLPLLLPSPADRLT